MDSSPSVCSLGCDKYLNSPLTVGQKPGIVLRVTFLVAGILTGCLLAYNAYPIGMCIAIGVAPLSLFFIDLIILACRSRKKSKNNFLDAMEVGKASDVERVLQSMDEKSAAHYESFLSKFIYVPEGATKFEILIRSGKFKLNAVENNCSLLEAALRQRDKPEIKKILLLLIEQEQVMNNIVKDYGLVSLSEFVFTEGNQLYISKVENFVKSQSKFTTEDLIRKCFVFHKDEAAFLDYFFKLLQSRNDFNDAGCKRAADHLDDNYQIGRDALLKYTDFNKASLERIRGLLEACANNTSQLKFLDLILDQITDTEVLSKLFQDFNAKYTAFEYIKESILALIQMTAIEPLKVAVQKMDSQYNRIKRLKEAIVSLNHITDIEELKKGLRLEENLKEIESILSKTILLKESTEKRYNELTKS